MSEYATPEDLEPSEDDLLLVVDWSRQAEGFGLMYQETGDTDYELMRIEAEALAKRQRQILSTAQHVLDSLG
jgi:hypothetical protein